MLTLILAVTIVLLSSGLCSGTEAALFSVSLLKVRRLAHADPPSPAVLALLAIREKMNRPITTIVILNNIANIGGSILIGSLAASVLGSRWIGLFSGILTFLVIIFAEIIPKTLGESYAEKIALLMARPVLGITRLLTPVVWGIEKVTTPFIKDGNRYTTNEAEIKLLAKIGHKEGVIEADESEMIQRIFDLNDMKAADLMTPRVAMTYLKGKMSLAKAKNEIMTSQHSRIAVVQETPDEVIGMALKEELLAAMIEGKGDSLVEEFLQEVHFVSESKRADNLLPVFQKTHHHLAVVIDEYGGVSGVITLEDVLEVLTGEIVDETDTIVDLQEFARKHRKQVL
jgi:CBS domain containing-hemolysin-like protein